MSGPGGDKSLAAARWIWRRLPPRDRRFALQRLETAEQRRRFLNSPDYPRFARQEAAFWAAEAPRPADEKGEGARETPARPPAAPSDPLAHPIVLRHFARLSCPEADDLWTWLAARFQDLPRVFLPGGGGEQHARILVDLGVARRVEASDLSPGLVERQNADASRAGYPIEWNVSDLNLDPIPERRYDLILAINMLHHLVSLEELARRLAAALTPGSGRLVVSDFVGPRHLEMPPSVRQAAEAMLRELPERLRTGSDGRPLGRLTFGDRWWTMKHCPFESIRSDAILTALRREFEFEIERPIGGTLILALMPAIIRNFPPGAPEADAWLTRIAQRDWELTRAGEIPNGYTFVLAKAKDKMKTRAPVGAIV